jgi:hypothetical protein
MTPHAALRIILAGLVLCMTGCDALSDAKGPASSASRMRAASRGGRVVWTAGEKPLGKWRVERQRIKVYDAGLVHVGDVNAEQDSAGALLALERVSPAGDTTRLVPEQDRWTLTGERGPQVVTLEASRLVVSDAQGQQLGAVTSSAGALVWTSFDESAALSAQTIGSAVTVTRGDEVLMRVLAQHIVPADALSQLIPGFTPLDRASLAMILVEWTRRHKG